MKNYKVSVYVSECQTDTFIVKANDLAEAEKIGMEEAVNREYDVDDVIDVKGVMLSRKEIVENEARENLADDLADMMNTDETIPDSAIDEFDADPAGTVEKYQSHYIDILHDCHSQDNIQTVRLTLDEKPLFIRRETGQNDMYSWRSKYYNVIIHGEKFILEIRNRDELGGSPGDQEYSWRLFDLEYVSGPMEILRMIKVRITIADDSREIEKAIWGEEKKPHSRECKDNSIINANLGL